MSQIDTRLAERLGSRHRLTGAETLAGRFANSGARQTRVRVSASPAVAGTTAGQHLLWMLANLLARQFAVIQVIEIALPRLPLKPGVALFGAAATLHETVAETVRLIAGPAVGIVVLDTGAVGGEVDVEVVVGATANVWVPERAPFQVNVFADGWNLYVGDPSGVPTIVPQQRNPFGAYFAACVAAGEVFKRLSGLKDGRGAYVRSLFMSLWDFEQRDAWNDMPTGEWPAPCTALLELPPAYVIGAGAVGQAVCASLAASGSALRGYITVIDRETVDETNLNRYPLASLSDLNSWKSALCAGVLEHAGFDVYAYDGGWPRYTADASRPPQRPDLKDLEAEYRYRMVLSCVDKNRARHAIQSFWPERLIGGSTLDLSIAVALYDMHSPFECLKCFNTPEPQGPTVEELAQELRLLHPAERRTRCESVGADWSAIEVYLASGRCGELGEQELAKFDLARRPTDWSVGFASVASGTLLAAQLVKLALIGTEAFPEGNGNTLRFSFLNPGPSWTAHRRRPGCECGSTGAADYQQLWPQHSL